MSVLDVHHQVSELGDTGPRETKLIEEVVAELGATVQAEITEGGSPARLLILKMPDGSRQVLKLLVDMPGAVDGHDLESFRLKLRQIDLIGARSPELARHCSPKVREFHGHDWAAYTMPYFPSEDIAACLRGPQPDQSRFFDQLSLTLDALGTHGWGTATREVPPGQIAEIHSDRVVRRYWLLEKYMPAAVTADEIVINGRACRRPVDLAQRLISEPELVARIDARRLSFPAHGDLNTRNLLITGTDDLRRPTFRVIDPRGSLEPWDLCYDLSKLLFSLTVWDAGLREGFVISGAGPISDGRGMTVTHRGGLYDSYRRAAEGLVGFFASHPVLSTILREDPGWQSRVLLGHAFHLLAEASCRLSDIKKRSGEATSTDLSPVELATGHFLFGMLFLEDAVSQLERTGSIDPASHLALIP